MNPVLRRTVSGHAMRTYPVLLVVAPALAAFGAPQVDAAKKDMEQLQGAWVVVSAEIDGKQTPPEELKTYKVVIRGDKVRLTGFDGEKIDEKMTFAVDPSRQPGWINFKDDAGVNFGIYALE